MALHWRQHTHWRKHLLKVSFQQSNVDRGDKITFLDMIIGTKSAGFSTETPPVMEETVAFLTGGLGDYYDLNDGK